MIALINRRRFSVAAASLALLASGLCWQSSAMAEPAIGKPAPDFALIDSNGQSQQLKAYRGKTVVLEWTNHDCPYVRKHYGTGNMQALQKQAAGDGVVWLSVISSAPGTQGYVEAAEANRLSRERDAAPTAVLLDPRGEVGRLYDARTTPHMYVIDGDGVLQYKGAIDDRPSSRHASVEGANNYVSAALVALKTGQPVSNAVTRPYGCSVKYGS
tara:strand:+ start:18 stop:659 length:642 start_codon:yes stop_codon:yes gene_type:complete